MNKIFFFDLDGTVTAEEILPKIAKRFGFHKKMHKLTESAILGNVPFEESFKYRHKILSKYDLKKIREVIKSIIINKNIKDFINTNSKQCRIVTGNLDVWIKPLQKKIIKKKI